MSVALPIVVLGDSIQWGQGLRAAARGAPSDKMAELVGAALAASPAVVKAWSGGEGIAVTVSRFASSGATINGPLGTPAALVPVTATTPFPGGEAPGPLPTVLDQATGAPSALGTIKPSDVRLVIVDGGINDVGLFTTILNPLVGSSTVAARANAACGGTLTSAATTFLPPGATLGNMSAVLTSVGSTFPNAVVVVTGYYDILSGSSDVLGLLITVGFLSGSLVPLLLLPDGWLTMALAGVIQAAVAAQSVIDNCAAFTAASNVALASAASLANLTPGGTWVAEGFAVPRFSFVPCPFTTANALFTGGSNGDDTGGPTAPAFLWGFNPSLGAISTIIDDAVVAGAAIGGIFGSIFGGPIGSAIGSQAGALAGAAAAVQTILPLLTPVDEVVTARTAVGGPCGGFLTCNLASVGHPNIEGEAAYAAAIVPSMITMFATSLPDVGLAGLVQVISKCMIATAALEPPYAEQVHRIRELRDAFIGQSPLARAFFEAASREYYAFSPVIVARMQKSPEFRERVRRFFVSPFLALTELLLGAEIGATLQASLDDLGPIDIAAASDEIARLSMRGGVTSTPSELGEMVNYFNVVMAEHVTNDQGYVDALLLEPLKLYWRLLCDW